MGFAAAISAMFDNPHMAETAQYLAPAGGAPRDVRIIRQAPDTVSDFGEARFVTASVMIDVRLAEVEHLEEGALFVTPSATYRIVGQPRRDSERLCWSGGAVEVA